MRAVLLFLGKTEEETLLPPLLNSPLQKAPHLLQQRLDAGMHDALVQHAMLVQLPDELDDADSALPRLHMCTCDGTRSTLAVAA